MIETAAGLRAVLYATQEEVAQLRERVKTQKELLEFKRTKIERLRDRVRRINQQRDGLLVGLDQKDSDIDRLRQETLVQSEAIETLRGLLHDGTEIATTDSPYETGTKARMRKWVARVREALGERE